MLVSIACRLGFILVVKFLQCKSVLNKNCSPLARVYIGVMLVSIARRLGLIILVQCSSAWWLVWELQYTRQIRPESNKVLTIKGPYSTIIKSTPYTVPQYCNLSPVGFPWPLAVGKRYTMRFQGKCPLYRPICARAAAMGPMVTLAHPNVRWWPAHACELN